MKIVTQSLGALILVLFTSQAQAEALKRVYLDKKNNVHLQTKQGRDRQVTRKGSASMLKLAPDNETVAWLVLNTWTAEGDDKPGSEELVIYRNGKSASIKCGPFIRDYWFWQNGNQVAIDCGGRRFAGREILYDVKTLKKLETIDQAEVPIDKRPEWSNSSDD
ncbi:hypothetical protein [Massilia haematophila]|uniref:Uncharacterized protein n=1 Tax=Massilia haematophila TaxID=457923 RepID=A0ABV7PRI6_9BURK